MRKKQTEKEKRDVVKNQENEERQESQKNQFIILPCPSMPVNKCDNCRARCCLFLANNKKGYCKACAEHFVSVGKAQWRK
jgi:hypothetical protein